MSMKSIHILTHTATHVVADMTMRAQVTMSMHISTPMATHAVVDMTMSMKDIPTPMATPVAAVTTMNIPMSTHTFIPMLTTFLVIPLTASAKSAIRMRNIATFAAKA